LSRAVCACSQRNGPCHSGLRGHGPLNAVIPRMCVCRPGGQQTRELLATCITPLYLQLMHVGRSPSKKLLTITIINHSEKPCVGYCAWLSAANSVMIVDSVSAFPHRLRGVSRGGCARCAWTREPLCANVVHRLLSRYAMTVVRCCTCEFIDSTKLIIKIEIIKYVIIARESPCTSELHVVFVGKGIMTILNFGLTQGGSVVISAVGRIGGRKLLRGTFEQWAMHSRESGLLVFSVVRHRPAVDSNPNEQTWSDAHEGGNHIMARQ